MGRRFKSSPRLIGSGFGGQVNHGQLVRFCPSAPRNVNIKIIDKKISESELREIAKDFYGEMVKGVVDIERKIIVMGGEYHMDANVILIKNGSNQQDVWGFNWYFDKIGDERIEYISLINIRPAQGNKTMEVQDASLRDKMKTIILKYLS